MNEIVRQGKGAWGKWCSPERTSFQGTNLQNRGDSVLARRLQEYEGGPCTDSRSSQHCSWQLVRSLKDGKGVLLIRLDKTAQSGSPVKPIIP